MDLDLKLPSDDDGPELPSDDDEGLSLDDLIGPRQQDPRAKKTRAATSKPGDRGRKRARRCAIFPPRKFHDFVNVLVDGKTVSPHPLPDLPIAHKPLKVLELFSGTGSVGEVFRQGGHEVVSLDIRSIGDEKPTHQVDIMEWDYKQYPPGTFSVVWASPPCEHYSIARTRAKTPRNLPHYDALVEKAVEIIDWADPAYWFIENPESGLLKKRPFMQDFPWADVDYCMYGAFYRKRTRLWGRLPPHWKPRKLCSFHCHACGDHRRHPTTAEQGSGWHLNQLHKIPPLLVRELVMAIS